MERAMEKAIDYTGMCLPLAAQIVNLLAESGASQVEMTAALNIADHLRSNLKASFVPASSHSGDE